MIKYAFTHCNILNGTESMTVQKDMTVTIEDDRIVSIVESAAIPDGAIEINTDGKYILPGLINLHAHLAGSGKPKKMKGLSRISVLAEKYKFIKKGIQDIVKSSILTQLNSGVTTIRSLGEIGHSDLQNRDMINSKTYIGPRVLVAGYGVTAINGHMSGSMAIECSSPEESRDLVDAEVKKNVDWVKIFVTGGVLDAISTQEPTILKMSLEIAQAACEQAHKAGRNTERSNHRSKTGIS